MRWRLALILATLVRGISYADDAPPSGPVRGGESAAPPVASPAAPAPTVTLAPTWTPEQAADAVLTTVKASDDAALKALALKNDPDPWLVADELIRRTEFDAADAFAKAAPRVDVERLPAYVASRRAKSDDVAGRARFAAASAAQAAGKFGEALDALGPADSGSMDDVIGIRLAMSRGVSLASLVRFEASAAVFLAAGEAAERLGWLFRADRSFDQSGSAAHRNSAFVTARDMWTRSLSISELRGDQARAASTLGNIGVAHYALGDYAKALLAYERALAAKDALGDKAGAADTLGNMGAVYSALGDSAKALATFERVREVMRALGDEAAWALVNIGVVYFSLGDYAKALATYEHAMGALQATGDKAGVANTLGNIGNVYNALGDYAKALTTYERALVALNEAGDKAGVATTLGNIGHIYASLGDHARALATYERARTLAEALGDKAGAALTLGNIGNVYWSLGDYPRALTTFERALAEKKSLGDRAGAATTLGALGNVYWSLGDYAKALATYELALATVEALGDARGAATALINIANALDSLGENAKGIKTLERAVRSAEKLGANGLLAPALGSLARMRLRSGDAGRAISDAHRAVLLLKTLVGGLGEVQGAIAREHHMSLFAVGLAAAATVDDAPEAVFFLESGRAGTLLESLDAREALRWAGLPEELRLAEIKARAGEARALAAYTKSLDGGDLAATRARGEELKAAQASVEEVVERIQRDAKKEARPWYPVATPIEHIQRFLAPGDALVLYGLAKEAAAHALVLTREDARIVELGTSAAIATACEALDVRDLDTDPAAALDRLRDLLITPLALPKEMTRLLVSPEGPLSYVPFSALLPGMDVAYEPSGTTYGVLLEDREKRGVDVLALGDPDYATPADATALALYAPTRGARLARLPATRVEATAVGDVTRFGKDASEAGLRDALGKKKKRWHAVHFACHGLVNPERPMQSWLALTPDAGDDGFLTMLEVLRMEIPSDLVVLSACETGKGRIFGGEGLVGLTRAFMFAGSPRVICSLWKVDDEATKALMVKFYELWNPKDGTPGLPTAQALRRAQDFIRSQPKWKHPYYWAAWALWGLPG